MTRTDMIQATMTKTGMNCEKNRYQLGFYNQNC